MTAREYMEKHVQPWTANSVRWKVDVFTSRKTERVDCSMDELLDAAEAVAREQLITARDRSADSELKYDQRDGHLVASLNTHRGDALL